MNNIESIFKNERHIWVCECGNCSFMIHEDGGIECSECDKPVVGLTTTLPKIRTVRKYD